MLVRKIVVDPQFEDKVKDFCDDPSELNFSKLKNEIEKRKEIEEANGLRICLEKKKHEFFHQHFEMQTQGTFFKGFVAGGLIGGTAAYLAKESISTYGPGAGLIMGVGASAYSFFSQMRTHGKKPEYQTWLKLNELEKIAFQQIDKLSMQRLPMKTQEQERVNSLRQRL